MPDSAATPPEPPTPGQLRRFPPVRPPFHDVPGPFQRARRDTSLGDQPTDAQTAGMRAFWWDGFFANVAETVLASYLGLYILAFGGGNGQIGVVTAVSSLAAALAFFPGARFAERYGRRKTTVLITGGGLARIALLGLAFVPWFADGDSAVWVVLVLVSLRGFFGFFAVPAWTSLTADIVPMGIRGRFLASRNFGMSLSALATAPLAGLLLDRFAGLDGWQLLWGIAFAAAMASTWFYARIPDPSPRPQAAHAEALERGPGLLADLLSDRNLVSYLIGTAVFNIGLQASGPFFVPYLANSIGASTLWIGALLALPSVTGLVGLVYFGRLMDERGTKWVMVTCGLVIPSLPAAWLFVSEPWHVVPINAFAGLVWAGYQIATTNMVMIMSPPEKRPRYAAAFQTVVVGSAFVGPLIGGVMIETLGFKPLVVFSAVGRLAGTLIMMRFVLSDRPRAHGQG